MQEEIKFACGSKRTATVIDAGIPGWEETLIRHFNTQSPPTAILSVDPELALKLYRPLLKKGISIPDDVSVAAIGRTPWAEAFIPSLTLSESDEATIVALAIDVLFQRITRSGSNPIRMEIHQSLFIRDSVAPPPQ